MTSFCTSFERFTNFVCDRRRFFVFTFIHFNNNSKTYFDTSITETNQHISQKCVLSERFIKLTHIKDTKTKWGHVTETFSSCNMPVFSKKLCCGYKHLSPQHNFFAKKYFDPARSCMEFNWFEFVCHEVEPKCTHFPMSHRLHCSFKLSSLQHRNELEIIKESCVDNLLEMDQYRFVFTSLSTVSVICFLCVHMELVPNLRPRTIFPPGECRPLQGYGSLRVVPLSL